MNPTKEMRVPLAPVATAESMGRLIRLVREHRQASSVLKLDASRIRELDQDRLQLLLAAVRGNAAVKILDPSDAVLRTIDSLGLLPHFETALEVSRIPEATAAADGQLMEATDMTKRILTIDDSKTMRDMLMLTLADAGFDVLQAVDGEDGMDVLKRERVDLVITDINMPKMDGYEVIRRMRAIPEFRKLPVLVLTTEAEADKRAIAKEVGATGWMVKPFDPERLVQTVLKVAA